MTNSEKNDKRIQRKAYFCWVLFPALIAILLSTPLLVIGILFKTWTLYFKLPVPLTMIIWGVYHLTHEIYDMHFMYWWQKKQRYALGTTLIIAGILIFLFVFLWH